MKSSRKDRTIRFFYGLLFFAWMFVLWYYIVGLVPAIRDTGLTIPGGEQIVPHNEHGYVVYITPTQHLLLELYGFAMILLFFGYIILGVILQAIYKVDIFIFNSGIPWPWSKFWPWSEMAEHEKRLRQTPKVK